MPNKIDSNLTGLSYALEQTLGVLPGSPTWIAVEPNSYAQFGGMTKLTKREPITASRMTRKGVVTDLEVNADFQVDLTMYSIRDLLPTFIGAPWVARTSIAPTAVSLTGTDHYTVSSEAGFFAGTLLLATGFDDADNNGLKRITAVAAGVLTCAGQDLVADASPAAAALVKQVGFQFASGDLVASAPGGIPTLVTSVADMTDVFDGLGAGDWVYVGGDAAGASFTATPGVNGWARIATLASDLVTFDKTQGTWGTDAGTGKTVQVFFGDTLQNQADPADQVIYPVQWERSLGTGGFEYVLGSIGNELTIAMAPSNKITVDMKFLAIDTETRTTGAGAKSGTRAVQVYGDALNTSTDFARLSLLDEDAAPVPGSALTNYVLEASVTLNNNASVAKALTVLGGFDITLGNLDVTGKMTSYFTDVDIIDAAKENRDISMDFTLVRDNRGMLFDIPRVAMSDARLNVVKDKPIEVPINLDGAEHPDLNYIMKVHAFDYLPAVAG